MKKRLSIILSVLLLAVTVVGCAKKTITPTTTTPVSKEKPDSIRIGYQLGINHTLLIVAKQKGWFEEEFKNDGIKLEYSQFTSGPPMIESFAGEKLDFGQVGDQPAIQARANSIDVRAIGIYASGYKGDGLIVPNGSDIKSIKDLKGKKVGITVGSTGHRLLYLFLESAGLKPSDVKEVNLQPADIKTAIATKSIDAAVTWEPWISTVEVEGIGHKVVDATGVKFGVNNIIVTGAFAEKYPKIVERVLKVYVKSEKWVKENPDKAIDLVATDTKMKREILAKSFPNVTFDLRITDEVTKSLNQTIKILRDNNTIRKDVKIEDLVDSSYLKSIGAQ